MTTLRTRIPVLICMLVDKGFSITFNNHFGLVLSWIKDDNYGHVHLDTFPSEQYGARSIEIEKELIQILAESGKV